MRYAGLYVGVDRQQDTEIEALAYAGRDAQVWWAAFADANEAEGHADPGATRALIGLEATRDQVRTALAEMVDRTRRRYHDLVTLHFSCHGTPDGHLVLADAGAADLAGTALPVAEITAAFRDLEAGCVLAVFESCFSGLAAGCTPDGDDRSLQAVMQALADGENRAVVWAAGPTERAYETPRLRHGVLTHALVVEGLYGTLGARDGAIDLARWVNDAVHRAEEHAARDGRHQRPGRVFRFTATPTIPRFRPGLRRERQLAEDRIHAVGADLSGLDAYGLDAATVATVRDRLAAGRPAAGGPRLTDLQCRAIAPHGALAGRSLLVSGPTSCGKTLVGELAALAAAARRLKTAFLLPMRALAAEKWADFESTYGPRGLRAVRSYGGAGDDDPLVMKGHFDVGFFTYEKFWLLALTNPRLLDTLGLVVVDEAHMIADRGRGHVVELILTLLRLRRDEGRPMQVLALSAALGDLRGLPEWLDATPVTETARPVPLREAVVGPSGRALVRDSRTPGVQEPVVALDRPVAGVLGRDFGGTRQRGQVASALAREALRRGEQVLVFRATRPAARALALEIARALERDAAATPCDAPLAGLGPERPENDESRASRALRVCLRSGVAFHISDLERAEREAVEAAFRAGALRVLVATSGLAMGVNLPANTVIIADHTRRQQRISVAEYRNMAGRAGRWMGAITHGTAYLVATRDLDAEGLWSAFVAGDSEPLDSQLVAMEPADLVLVLMALRAGAVTADDLTLRAAATFGGHQRRRDDVARGALNDDIVWALDHLESEGLVRRVAAAAPVGPGGAAGPATPAGSSAGSAVGSSGTASTSPPAEVVEPAGSGGGAFALTEYGLVCGREGLRWESAARVLRGAEIIHSAGEPLNEIALIALAQVTRELDDLWTPAEDTRTAAGQEELAGWHDQSQLTLGRQPALLTVLRESAGHDGRYLQRLKRLNAISMWVRGRRLEEIEDAFTMFVPEGRQQRTEPASGAVRSAGERTADVLRAVGKLVALRYPALADGIREQVVALLPRLEHGVVREATALMRLGLGIRRGVAVQLIAAGIASPAALFDALERDAPALYPILTSEGVHRMRAAAGAIIQRRPGPASPDRLAESRAATQRRLFDQIGDATDL